MHYFKRNIGDYHKKAGRLSMLQHGAYTLLMDACYDRERFPTMAEAIEWVWASNPDEIAALELVLARFFVLDDGKFHQQRIADEIEDYRNKANKNKEIALEREAKRRDRKERGVHEPCTDRHLTTNHKPLTTNQEPDRSKAIGADGAKPKKEKPPSLGVSFLEAQGVDRQHATDWLKARKVPLTQTAWAAIERESAKAGITSAMAVQVSAENSWRGFRADWYDKTRIGNGSHQQSNQRVDNSAVGRVKRAIAEGQAREAVAEPLRYAEPQDGGDLRTPLDGEFWRED